VYHLRKVRFAIWQGTIYLYIPKLRKGGHVPFFETERKRSEMALATLVQEAFIDGNSTWWIERLAQALGVENISASEVSEINKEFEGQVESFRSRPPEEEYPFLMIDAHYDKVRVEDRVMTLALMIAHGVNGNGIREILASVLPEAEKARPATGQSVYLGRPYRHPGRGEKGAPGRLPAALQGPLNAEHPGQGSA
jgi:transposase-like protein